MTSTLRLLHVEDSPDDSALILHHLKKGGLVSFYERVDSKEPFLAALENRQWDLVICDYNLPHFEAMEALSILKRISPELPFIVLSGSIGEERAVELMRAGASDYVMKDNLTRLIPVIQRELQEAELRKERRRIEEALKISESNLRQAQKLESIGLLAGGIAHDFNNILATIILQSELLIHELDINLPVSRVVDKVQKSMEEIKKSSERATGLTRKLLAFSRRQMLQPTVLSLNALILDMQDLLQRIVEENIEFKIDLSSHLKNVYIDKGHVEQILLNLVINSRDAMPQGGFLKIETQDANIDEAIAKKYHIDPGPYVLLTVSDSGMGISDEIKHSIFEPFFTTKPAGKGTGLGLSTVYGIVQQSKGHISVESKVGQGASFKLFFPATEENVKAGKSITKEVPLTGTELILIVEDEPVLKNLIGEILAMNGYKVLKASHGIEALEVIKANPGIQLVISDVVMPQMGGIELAGHAGKVNNKIKFLFQSGYMADTLTENGVEAEKIHFIQKPYKPNDLLAEVRKILS